VRLAAAKQRALCLTAAHVDCQTFRAAMQLDETGPRPSIRWRFGSTTPTALDRGGLAGRLAAAPRRIIGQGLLAILLVAALVILASGYLPGIGVATPTGPAASATPSGSPPSTAAAATPTPSASSTPLPTSTPVATTPPPAATPSLVPTPASSVLTYVVQSGDTLYAIAGRFGTTVAAIQAINGIADPSIIRPGQVLLIP
jgi:LysM repeat protein